MKTYAYTKGEIDKTVDIRNLELLRLKPVSIRVRKALFVHTEDSDGKVMFADGWYAKRQGKRFLIFDNDNNDMYLAVRFKMFEKDMDTVPADEFVANIVEIEVYKEIEQRPEKNEYDENDIVTKLEQYC